MIFLNPSILIGLLAASIPILIHILNFRKLQKVEFSTLTFLKELQKSKIRKIKIKQWLLLLLRTLIIIFLVLAFARPTLESTTLSGATSSAKSSSVFLIDNSLSMAYIDERGSLLNTTKTLAKEIISGMQEGDEFIFMLNNDSLVSFTNRESAISFVNNINITRSHGSAIQKLREAIDALSESQNINKEVYFFSDFQASIFDEGDFRDTSAAATDNDFRLYAFDISAENPVNYSVSDLKLENAVIEVDKPLTFSVNVSNSSSNSLNDARISLFLNNKRVAQTNISLSERENKTIEFETTLSNDGLIEAFVQLEDDEILEDNKAFMNFFVPEAIDVLIVYNDESELMFLEPALKSSSTSGKIRINKIKPESLFYESLQETEYLVLLGSSFDTPLNILDYLENGGNILFVPGDQINIDQLSRLSNLLGLPETERVVSSGLDEINYMEFEKIEFNHPFFRDLFEETAQRKIESPNIFKYIKFSDSPRISSIIRLMDETVFLGEYFLGKGKVVFFNISLNLKWSNFPIKGIFAPLISRISSYLSRSTLQNDGYYSGENIPIYTENITFPLVDVILPEGNDKINLDDFNYDIYNYSNSSQVGSYKFFNNNELIYYTVVNINPLESDLTKIDLESAKDYFDKLFSKNYMVFNREDNFFEMIKQARFGTELWTYFLIFSLILAIIEMFIARSTKKDLVSISEQ